MEKTALQGDLLSVLITKSYEGDQINNNEICGVCGTHGRQEGCIHGFGGEN